MLGFMLRMWGLRLSVQNPGFLGFRVFGLESLFV